MSLRITENCNYLFPVQSGHPNHRAPKPSLASLYQVVLRLIERDLDAVTDGSVDLTFVTNSNTFSRGVTEAHMRRSIIGTTSF